LENSDFNPANRRAMVFFSVSAISTLLYQVIWFPCVKCVSCRTYSTYWFPLCPDAFSCPSSCCNYAACILCMPMLFSCAQLPPPLNFSCVFSCHFWHKKKTYFRRSITIT
jgi:hypothetical protein